MKEPALTAFLERGINKRLRLGVVSLSNTQTQKNEIYSVREFVPTLVCELGLGQGKETADACNALAEAMGAKWVHNAIPVRVPEPIICVGCGRALLDGLCPQLMATGKKSHGVKA